MHLLNPGFSLSFDLRQRTSLTLMGMHARRLRLRFDLRQSTSLATLKPLLCSLGLDLCQSPCLA